MVRAAIDRAQAQGFFRETDLHSYDVGGGVIYDGSFLVHTEVEVPNALRDSLHSSGLVSRLTAAAAAVELELHIHDRLTLCHTGDRLQSLEIQQLRVQSTYAQFPFFYLNAAVRCVRGIAIAHGPRIANVEVVTTLLAVLRRPWCVLELCCATIRVVEVLLEFARIACLLDASTFRLAVQLLDHERIQRTQSLVSDTPPITPAAFSDERAKRAFDIVRIIDSQKSAMYGLAWLKSICFTVFWLDISFLTFGCLLMKSVSSYEADKLRIQPAPNNDLKRPSLRHSSNKGQIQRVMSEMALMQQVAEKNDLPTHCAKLEELLGSSVDSEIDDLC